jgi:hypothetical protein
MLADTLCDGDTDWLIDNDLVVGPIGLSLCVIDAVSDGVNETECACDAVSS